MVKKTFESANEDTDPSIEYASCLMPIYNAFVRFAAMNASPKRPGGNNYLFVYLNEEETGYTLECRPIYTEENAWDAHDKFVNSAHPPHITGKPHFIMALDLLKKLEDQIPLNIRKIERLSALKSMQPIIYIPDRNGKQTDRMKSLWAGEAPAPMLGITPP